MRTKATLIATVAALALPGAAGAAEPATSSQGSAVVQSTVVIAKESFNALTNVMKARSDAARAAIQNVR